MRSEGTFVTKNIKANKNRNISMHSVQKKITLY